MLVKRCVAVFALIASVHLAGCGPEDEVRPPLQPAEGMLTINNQPAAGAMLVLHPANGKGFDSRMTRPRATVGADGKFHLTTYQEGDESTFELVVAGRALDESARWQALNYLRSAQLSLGLVLHFGPKATFRRVVF